MADEIENDATKALADFKAVGATLETAEVKVKAWYKAFPFYVGLVVGAIATIVIPFAIKHFP